MSPRGLWKKNTDLCVLSEQPIMVLQSWSFILLMLFNFCSTGECVSSVFLYKPPLRFVSRICNGPTVASTLLLPKICLCWLSKTKSPISPHFMWQQLTYCIEHLPKCILFMFSRLWAGSIKSSGNSYRNYLNWTGYLQRKLDTDTAVYWRNIIQSYLNLDVYL